jgi:hypothetical protein
MVLPAWIAPPTVIMIAELILLISLINTPLNGILIMKGKGIIHFPGMSVPTAGHGESFRLCIARYGLVFPLQEKSSAVMGRFCV